MNEHVFLIATTKVLQNCKQTCLFLGESDKTYSPPSC